MPNPFGYRFLLSAEAFRSVFILRTPERRVLAETFQFLADHPYFIGDYQERDEDGRLNGVLLRGRFTITFWPDHAVKEVRIVRVEKS